MYYCNGSSEYDALSLACHIKNFDGKSKWHIETMWSESEFTRNETHLVSGYGDEREILPDGYMEQIVHCTTVEEILKAVRAIEGRPV